MQGVSGAEEFRIADHLLPREFVESVWHLLVRHVPLFERIHY